RDSAALAGRARVRGHAGHAVAVAARIRRWRGFLPGRANPLLTLVDATVTPRSAHFVHARGGAVFHSIATPDSKPLALTSRTTADTNDALTDRRGLSSQNVPTQLASELSRATGVP